MSSLRSWLYIPKNSHFSLANIPFGIISTAESTEPRPAIAIGDCALDLKVFAANNGFSALSTVQPHHKVFSEPTLNAFAALGRPIHSIVRKYLQNVFLDDTPFPEVLKTNPALQKQALVPLKELQTHLPFTIGDYTDFYAGLNHAYNAGVVFRGPNNALQPNYKHLPVGYHGRASSVVVSGTDIRRPKGQILENPAAEKKVPILASTRKLDIELELGAFICRNNAMGESVSVDEAEQTLFGLVLLNDWSARDIQGWEAVPLGPFLSKSFGTSISPWVVLADALEPFLVKGLENDTQILPYLQEAREKNVYNINLAVTLKTSSSESRSTICKTNSRNLLFSFPQMIAHHTVSGCPLRVGDLLGSGTISGTSPSSCGSLLEQNANGKGSIALSNGENRTFLEDGDEVRLSGFCGEDDVLVGFGECIGKILPSL
ncbi:Fumarylacetoacetase [Patellaria atrata CBS 101060]|uniref:Fumarylacetoacetase n=1 Tax=Patellaria atrata CBS 101060 TaxID=1346257 RepID=A0A9P4SH66_9PEZI|nr:Fumarylacetoacetase [Patellaria atrata CBS 101060]